MFLLVPAHPGSPGQRAVKRLLLLLCCCCCCVVVSQARINCGRKGIWHENGTIDGGGLLIGLDGVVLVRIVGVSASCYPP